MDQDDDEQDRRPREAPAWYEPPLVRVVAALGRLRRGVRRSLLRIPRRVRVVVASILAVMAVFGATLIPFLARSPVVKAEVTGRIPTTLTAADGLQFQVAVDNTGDASIHELCVLAGFDRTATLVSAVFNGVDAHAATGNRVCGGSLNGGAVVGVRLVLSAAPGPLHVALRPEDGSTVIGPVLEGTVSIG